MTLGFSTSCFYPQCNVEDAVDILGRLGAPVIEVFLNAPSEHTASFGRELARRAADYGTAIHSVHPLGTQFEPQLFSPQARQCRDAEASFCRVLEAARAMGARSYVMHGLANLKNRMPMPLHFPAIGQRLDALAGIAAQFGITLCIENVFWCFYHQPDFPARLAKHMQHPEQLSFVLDTKQALLSGHAPLDYLAGMGRLSHVHLCDVGRGGPLMPGRGTLDFAALFKKVSALNPNAPCLVEVYRSNFAAPDDLARCRDRLLSIAACCRKEEHP
nr:sugar phosphate isomerase/epimerase [bacterium]